MKDVELQAKKFAESFPKNGYFVLDLLDTSSLLKAREDLQAELRRYSGSKSVTLETYHELDQSDETHTETQIHMTEYYRSRKWGKAVAEEQVDFFRRIIGEDLLVQRSPYLRITRPRKGGDNIGYHRDTFYGGSPYELSFLVPFVDLPPESSLNLVVGSHELPENHYRFTQVTSDEVTKGSLKHQLGFLYAPKLVDDEQVKSAQPIPLRLGQALIFSLSIMHGSILNTGKNSRWSSDIRVMNALAPVDLSARPEYYEPLHWSEVTASARRYFDAQAK